jgi:hypothetical protein
LSLGTRTIAPIVLLVLLVPGRWAAAQEPPHAELDWFFAAAAADGGHAERAMRDIARHWREGYAAMIVDIARLMRPAQRVETEQLDVIGVDEDRPADFTERRNSDFGRARRPDPPSAKIRTRLLRFLERQTGQRLGDDLHRWREWIWNRPYAPHPDYATFKARVYSAIDPRMAAFFPPGVSATIRLDEIDWGGVPVNGIPPLDRPKVIRASEATYLKDSNVVFATAVNGEARAYPKRILAWHEMALDRLGGVELTIVYCTLCGTAIPYGSVVGDQRRTFGTSGLLYRSNKLMFDHETNSLWSTIEGHPVVGPLVGKGLELTPHWMVTTTWGEWRTAHPDTTVLALDTGFRRDYSEGAAYREYFDTDRLMFTVPRTDPRLKNKAEVLAFRLPIETGEQSPARKPVAIAATFLARNRLYQATVHGVPIVVITTAKGANRAYLARDVRFTSFAGDAVLIDPNGRRWTIGEDALTSIDGARLERIPAYRAFWFGWYAQYPDTVLVK